MENPLVGNFNRERTVLIFRQRYLEFVAAWIGLAVGCMMLLAAYVSDRFLPFLPSMPRDWLLFFGFCFVAASFWAMLLFCTIRFDIRKRRYHIRTRIGLLPKFSSGSVDEIRHLELAPYDGIVPGIIVQSISPKMVAAPTQLGHLYVIRLHWQDSRKAPIVIEHVQAMQGYGPHDSGVMGFVQKAQSYSNALGVPLFSHLPLPGLTRRP